MTAQELISRQAQTDGRLIFRGLGQQFAKPRDALPSSAPGTTKNSESSRPVFPSLCGSVKEPDQVGPDGNQIDLCDAGAGAEIRLVARP